MTNEDVMKAFKEKGIEVTIYETPFHTIETVVIDTSEHDKQIRAEVIDELYNKIDEGVCDICEHKDFESDCFKTCNFEVENAKKWLLKLKGE